MLENAELWKMHNIQFHLRCAATVLENAAEDGKVWEMDGGGGSRGPWSGFTNEEGVETHNKSLWNKLNTERNL